jgi:hypothetical protein
MIKNAPKAPILLASGKELLNLSWRLVIDILRMQEEVFFEQLWQRQKNMFWKNARREILTAHTLLVQGIELIIKSRIANVSPLLLIERLTENSIRENEDFCNCKTIQESVLVSYHNKIVDKKISPKFAKDFKKMLTLRNEIIHLETTKHTKVLEIKMLANKVLSDIMYVSEKLLQEKWFKIREHFLEESVEVFDDGITCARMLLCEEFEALKNSLTASEYVKFFHHNKKAKTYYCINCYNACNEREFDNYKFATIDPKDPKKIYCPVCGTHYTYQKYKCSDNFCRGALHADGRCLCCLGEN